VSLDPDRLVQVEHLIRLAEYHRSAMEARRSLGFRAFVALVGAELLIGKAVLENAGGGLNLGVLRWIAIASFIVPAV